MHISKTFLSAAFIGLVGFSALNAQANNTQISTAVFAGGCFWCMEKPFDNMTGVIETTAGFSGGHVPNPSYKAVSNGGTGHIEVIRVRYNPAQVSYAQLLGTYWKNVDPFDSNGQFCDRGETYRPAIFVSNPAERAAAEASKASLARDFGRNINVEIISSAPFYAAEEYHQDYYKKNPIRYNYYRTSCGRDARLRQVWGAQNSKR